MFQYPHVVKKATVIQLTPDTDCVCKTARILRHTANEPKNSKSPFIKSGNLNLILSDAMSQCLIPYRQSGDNTHPDPA